MDATEKLRTIFASGPPPLVAARTYRFQAHERDDGVCVLMIPVVQRGTWDDFGVEEHPEQAVFLDRFFAQHALVAKATYPGEWHFADRATLDRAWSLLCAGLPVS